jgi:universal stress protein E
MLVALALDPQGRALTTGSRLAAEQALALAPALGAELVLLHSTAADEGWDPDETQYVAVPDGLSPEGHRVLEELTERFRAAGVAAELVLAEEAAWLAIVHRVQRDRIDLVMAGKRDELERSQHPIGSVAMKLLRKCPSAVWVARPGGVRGARRVLAATDLTPVGERVIEFAAYVTPWLSAELHVVHALQMPLAVQLDRRGEAESFEQSRSKEVVRVLRGQLARAGLEGEASFHVGLTSPARAILRCVERLAPELVVMGTVSRGGIAGVLVGNTAERLLGRLDCSLLTVKPADFVSPVPLETPGES